MTLRNLSIIGSALLLAGSALRAFGGEILVNETFDAFNLDEPPQGWSRAERPMLSLVDEEGRGKILKISNRDEHYPFVAFNVDPQKAAGKIVRATISARFPGAYVPIADKLSASPKFLIESKDDLGNTLGQCELIPQAGKTEWQELKKEFTVPAGATNVQASVCIQFVTAEVSFDNMKLEVVGEASPPTPPTPPATAIPATPATPATPAPPAVAADQTPPANAKRNLKNIPKTVPAAPSTPADPNSPEGRAAKAPSKTLADDGMSFGPESALKLLPIRDMKKATAHTVMYVGPGFAEKDPQPKLSSDWKALPLSSKLTGKTVTPRALLGVLPEALFKEKPEVVLIAADGTAGRKATTTEAEDWEDLAKLCSRFGAVPVFVLPGPTKDEAYEALILGMKKAMEINNVATLSAVPQEVYLRRVPSMLALLDQHVFMRGKNAEAKPGATDKTGKVVDE